jgi:hypothetical protein
MKDERMKGLAIYGGRDEAISGQILLGHGIPGGAHYSELVAWDV